MSKLLVLLMAFGLNCAAQPDLRCPDFFEVTSSVAATPSGWQSQQESKAERHPLRAVTFTDGHPRERAFLRPNNARDDARTGQRTDIYDFTAPSAGGIWLVCQYQETRQTILPIKAKHCEVQASTKGAKPVTGISCR